MKPIKTIITKYFGSHLDFRVRLFNVLAIIGTTISLISTIDSAQQGDPVSEVLMYLGFTVLAAGLLVFSAKTGRYKLCYIITIVAIFLIGFPIFFLNGGGYFGSMPYFFVFAVVFTIFMLEGKTAIVLAVLELGIYTALCFYAHHFSHASFELNRDYLFYESVFGFVLISVALGAAMFLQIRMYNKQQHTLEIQNAELDRINQYKTKFLADISHELKTPLTVISVHTQRAELLMELNRVGDAEKVQESFSMIKDEIMRLSRLVDSTLQLSSMQELGGEKSVLDIVNVLRVTAETYKTLAEKHGNRLILDLPENLPSIFASTDGMIQVLSNLLSNAVSHTQNGEIRISAEVRDEKIQIHVSDDGEGIEPELLPRIFERRVGNGNGLGLTICKQIARSNDGEIGIESEKGRGTTVTVTLPVYQEA